MEYMEFRYFVFVPTSPLGDTSDQERKRVLTQVAKDRAVRRLHFLLYIESACIRKIIKSFKNSYIDVLNYTLYYRVIKRNDKLEKN